MSAELQKPAIPAEMACGDLFDYRYFCSLSCVPNLEVRRKSDTWLGHFFHHIYIGGQMETRLYCVQKHIKLPTGPPENIPFHNCTSQLRKSTENDNGSIT